MSDEEKLINHIEDYRLVAGTLKKGSDDLYKVRRARWDHFTSKLEVAPVPLHIDIELTNICDLSCVMCERKLMHRPLGMMSFEVFKNIVDESREIGVDSFKLNLWGESLLHPNLVRMVRYIRDNSDIVTQFNTNANKLTAEKSKELITAGLDKLTISFDGLSKETYEAIRVKGSFDKVVQNIDMLIRNKTELQSDTPYITIQIIRMETNEAEIAPFVEYWKNKVDFISVTNIGATVGTEEILAYAQRERLEHARLACSQLWQRLSIFWDGTVTVCCNDFDGFLKLGKYGDMPLAQFWVCERLNELRQKHKRRDFSQLICANCTETFSYRERSLCD